MAMNEFDSLMGFNEIDEQELAGWFSRMKKRVKRSARKLGKFVKKTVKSPVGKIAIAAASVVGGGLMIKAGLTGAAKLMNKAEAAKKQADAILKKNPPLPKKAATVLKKAEAIAKKAPEKKDELLANSKVAQAVQRAQRNIAAVSDAGNQLEQDLVQYSGGDVDQMKRTVATLRGQGKTNAEIRDLYLTSKTYQKQALPMVEGVAYDAVYKDLIAQGVDPALAKAAAEREAPVYAAQAVGNVQQTAAAGDMKKLLPFAIPAALFLMRN